MLCTIGSAGEDRVGDVGLSPRKEWIEPRRGGDRGRAYRSRAAGNGLHDGPTRPVRHGRHSRHRLRATGSVAYSLAARARSDRPSSGAARGAPRRPCGAPPRAVRRDRGDQLVCPRCGAGAGGRYSRSDAQLDARGDIGGDRKVDPRPDRPTRGDAAGTGIGTGQRRTDIEHGGSWRDHRGAVPRTAAGAGACGDRSQSARGDHASRHGSVLSARRPSGIAVRRPRRAPQGVRRAAGRAGDPRRGPVTARSSATMRWRRCPMRRGGGRGRFTGCRKTNCTTCSRRRMSSSRRRVTKVSGWCIKRR